MKFRFHFHFHQTYHLIRHVLKYLSIFFALLSPPAHTILIHIFHARITLFSLYKIESITSKLLAHVHKTFFSPYFLFVFNFLSSSCSLFFQLNKIPLLFIFEDVLWEDVWSEDYWNHYWCVAWFRLIYWL